MTEHLAIASAILLVAAALCLAYLMQSAYAPRKPVPIYTSCRFDLSPPYVKWCW